MNPAEQYTAWLKDLKDAAQKRRQVRLDELKAPGDVKKWIADHRAWFRGVVGPLVPLEEPMRIEQCGTISMDGYTIEKWRFEVMPGTMAAALLYVPAKIAEKGPIICAPIGHWDKGKSNDDYQKMGGFMAYNGIPVLVFEHAGLGERRAFRDPVTGLNITGDSPTDEHNHNGTAATLLDDMPLRTYVTEAARAREFLASFPWADRERIGYTGASGGGTMSYHMAAYEDDAAFSIPVCIIGGEEIGGTSDAEQACWHAGVRGATAVDSLACMCPRPAMIVRETGFDQAAQAYATLRKIYDAAGASAEATQFLPIDDKHGYTAPMTEAVYHFLAANFSLKPADPETWAHVRMLPEEQTWTGPTGDLTRDTVQITLRDQICAMLPDKPAGLNRERLAQLMAIADVNRAPIAYRHTGTPRSPVIVQSWIHAPAEALGLLDWEDHPAEWYHRRGIVGRSHRSGEARHLLFFDRSLVGLWTRQVLDFLDDHADESFALSGERFWALPVLLAAALNDPKRPHRFEVRYLLQSFRSSVEEGASVVPVSQAVQGILKYGDIDDIIALAGDRVTVAFRTDPQGRVVRE